MIKQIVYFIMLRNIIVQIHGNAQPDIHVAQPSDQIQKKVAIKIRWGTAISILLLQPKWYGCSAWYEPAAAFL